MAGMNSRASGPKKKRRLHSGHFMFIRAVVQGLDAKQSWQRYLRIDGENPDARRVKNVVQWIRDEFAAAAKQHNKPGTARLVLIDASKIKDRAPAMSLQEFAEARGLEDFSEAEQLEAYQAEFGKESHGSGRRRQLVSRQLEAVAWLERVIRPEPRPSDSVEAWFAPELAKRLAASGTPTLFALSERINSRGARWWRGVPGVGTLKANRIVEWLQEQGPDSGFFIQPHALKPMSSLTEAELSSVVTPKTALVPFEKFVVPTDLDGHAGLYRGDRGRCLLQAATDKEAIQAWLGAKGTGRSGATERTYRKEAERLLLWSVLVRGKAMSSLSSEDAAAFSAFLENPPLDWCGSRNSGRWSPDWRPLERGLSDGARRQSIIILRSLFAYWVSKHYVIGNPFSGMRLPKQASRSLSAGRSLDFHQWDLVTAHLAVELQKCDDEVRRRTVRAVKWLYATGLRLSELVSVSCGMLEPRRYVKDDGSRGEGWMLIGVIGKGEIQRNVAVPAALVEELNQELASAGLAGKTTDPENRDVRILGRFDARGSAWSASGMYKAVKGMMMRCAESLPADDPDRLMIEKATTHWLRHTHATHALGKRPGSKKAPVPLHIVRTNMGHQSLATTSRYVDQDTGEQLQAAERFWSGGA